MSDRAIVKLADIKRAIRAAKDSGLSISEIFIQPDGVRLICGDRAQNKPKYDDPRIEQWSVEDTYDDPRLKAWPKD